MAEITVDGWRDANLLLLSAKSAHGVVGNTVVRPADIPVGVALADGTSVFDSSVVGGTTSGVIAKGTVTAAGSGGVTQIIEGDGTTNQRFPSGQTIPSSYLAGPSDGLIVRLWYAAVSSSAGGNFRLSINSASVTDDHSSSFNLTAASDVLDLVIRRADGEELGINLGEVREHATHRGSNGYQWSYTSPTPFPAPPYFFDGISAGDSIQVAVLDTSVDTITSIAGCPGVMVGVAIRDFFRYYTKGTTGDTLQAVSTVVGSGSVRVEKL